MRPLSMVPSGTEVVIVEIRGGWRSAKRLQDMGLLPGVRLRVINNMGRAPILIELNNSKLAIGRGLAQKVIVR
ncbi:hypothetical protein DRQ20_00330 [bacterium]|nr:MAG: hypothetical protein DRQ20_00330 [bacterium]